MSLDDHRRAVAHDYLLEALGCAPDQLPTLPDVAIRVAQLAGGDEHSAANLAREVGRDQSLAGKVLAAANSPLHGCRGRVDDLSRAVVILGFDQLRALALGLAAFEAAGVARPMRRRMRRLDLWAHARRAAVLCEALARHELGLGPGYYAHGLLHDIGKVALDAHRPADYEKAMDLAGRHGLPALLAERMTMGLDHAQVGQALLSYWDFPPAMTRAVGLHHQPWTDDGDGVAAGVVFLADLLAGAENGPGLPRRLELTPPAAEFVAGMGWVVNEITLERLDDRLRALGEELDPLAG
ncbi:putative signal transduction protein [Desulfarculus baarsii DSM 2075]|uniref:Signal transduction protein n=1 Tax=Desulfarculus baarsii (strain ATCC 33931 / DSM 2075 / LMG 7858 / VKM B-1802 / 2st14) TaxID=644282 RepID=E1QL83_DESB2|nr:HDOD domain-containing protein [Desulfarculus baarsii]ADK85348.1 putative signal transduction protein [Desulfarculus baarsii DSM 2075]